METEYTTKRMIKIITTKKWKKMLTDLEEANRNLEEVRSATIGLHELMKGQYNKYGYEISQKEDTIKELEAKVKDLEKRLNKSEHERNELRKKSKKEKNKAVS